MTGLGTVASQHWWLVSDQNGAHRALLQAAAVAVVLSFLWHQIDQAKG